MTSENIVCTWDSSRSFWIWLLKLVSSIPRKPIHHFRLSDQKLAVGNSFSKEYFYRDLLNRLGLLRNFVYFPERFFLHIFDRESSIRLFIEEQILWGEGMWQTFLRSAWSSPSSCVGCIYILVTISSSSFSTQLVQSRSCFKVLDCIWIVRLGRQYSAACWNVHYKVWRQYVCWCNEEIQFICCRCPFLAFRVFSSFRQLRLVPL